MTTPAPKDSAATLAIVIPCYQSTSTLRDLTRRLLAAFANGGRTIELIFIDDASPNGQTWNTLKALHSEFPKVVRCFRLARNAGQHNAIQCGFAQTSPNVEIVVTMDDDLQHRPEDVPSLVAAIEEGADLAVGAYENKRHAAWRNIGGQLVDGALRRIFQLPHDFQLTSFRAMRRFVADDVVENQSRYGYLTAALLAVTRFRVNVPVVHQERREGRSGYSLATSLELAANLFLSYSRWPLYLVVCLFLLSLLATASVTTWVFWRWLVSNHVPAGWTSTMLMLGIGNTFNLAALAVIALLSTRSHRQLVGTSGRWRIAERS
jgi:glycosyltransferase involved in cell wall biosynthesis